MHFPEGAETLLLGIALLIALVFAFALVLVQLVSVVCQAVEGAAKAVGLEGGVVASASYS